MNRRFRGDPGVLTTRVDDPAIDAATRWLRRSYRVGALVDGLAAVGMIFPGPLWTANFQAPFDRNRAELTYGMRSGAPLMAGWMLLMLWADRQPMQRKGVLPLTCAIVIGLMANDAAAASAGQVPGRSLLPTRLLQTSLLGLFGGSYVRALATRRRSGRG
jgi:hypothetical protein